MALEIELAIHPVVLYGARVLAFCRSVAAGRNARRDYPQRGLGARAKSCLVVSTSSRGLKKRILPVRFGFMARAEIPAVFPLERALSRTSREGLCVRARPARENVVRPHFLRRSFNFKLTPHSQRMRIATSATHHYTSTLYSQFIYLPMSSYCICYGPE